MHCQSQTERARAQKAEILRRCSSHTMCHISCVTCHMSPVTCHLSHVKCKKKNFFFLTFFFFKKERKKKLSFQKNWTKWWSQLSEGLISTRPTPSSFYVNISCNTWLYHLPCLAVKLGCDSQLYHIYLPLVFIIWLYHQTRLQLCHFDVKHCSTLQPYHWLCCIVTPCNLPLSILLC